MAYSLLEGFCADDRIEFGTTTADGDSMAKILRFGAITYTRNNIQVGWSDWETSGDGAERKAIAGDPARLTAFTNYKGSDTNGPGRRDMGKKKVEVREEYDPVALLTSAVAQLPDNIDYLVISGFGPFESPRSWQAGVSQISREADRPFRSLDIKSTVAKLTGIPHSNISIVTDVGAVAIATYWSIRAEAREMSDNSACVVAAFIVDQGIGGAVVQRGGEVIGQNHHTEMGHIPVRPHPDDPIKWPERSQCDHHEDCLHGRASAKAMIKRAIIYKTDWLDVFDNPVNHEDQWKIEADYLGQLCATAVFCFAPTHIVFCGATIDAFPGHLLEHTRAALQSHLRNYVHYDAMEAPFFMRHVDMDEAMIVGALLYGLQSKADLRAV